MSAVCLCFEAHLPTHLRAGKPVSPTDGNDLEYAAEDDGALDRLAESCYLPANRLLGNEIDASGGRFRIALSTSGPLIGRMMRHRPDVLDSFRQLVAGGGIELLAAPWHRSLSFLHSNREFDRQVDVHLGMMEKIFHIRPRVFHNTDLIYNDSIAAKAETMGFDGVLADFGTGLPGGISADRLYRAPETARIKTLPRHGGFSGELGRETDGGRLPDVGDFTRRIAALGGELTVIFLRYEALAGLNAKDPAKTRFWQSLPEAADDAGLQWVTPSEAVDLYDAMHSYPCAKLTSWNDPDGRFSPWAGNSLQFMALERIHSLEKQVHAAQDAEILDAWAGLQAAHHFHWMSATPAPSMRHPEDACPYHGPEDAHCRVMAALDRLESRLAELRGGIS